MSMIEGLRRDSNIEMYWLVKDGGGLRKFAKGLQSNATLIPKAWYSLISSARINALHRYATCLPRCVAVFRISGPYASMDLHMTRALR